MNIGAIVQWGSNTIPDGWLLCDGSAVSRVTYADLFGVIGTQFGTGDGSTTFNLPDLRGRVGVGLDGNDSDFNAIGKTGGEKKHTLTINEMAPHNHVYGYSVKTFYGSGETDVQTVPNVFQSGDSPENYILENQGKYGEQAASSTPFNVVQPSIVTNYIIKATIPDTIKISELESAVDVGNNDLLPIVQSGETKKITYSNLMSDINSSIDTIETSIAKLGKLLWSGSFSSGSITVPGLSNYTCIAVATIVGDLIIFGTPTYGYGGYVDYGADTLVPVAYRFNYNPVAETLTIDEINHGIISKGEVAPALAIYGIF